MYDQPEVPIRAVATLSGVSGVIEGTSQANDARLHMPRRMHPIGQQHRVALPFEVDPYAGAREAGVADAARAHQITTTPAWMHQHPAEAAAFAVRLQTGVLGAQIVQ